MSAARERLPDTRDSITRKITVGLLDVYVRVGLYPDGRPGELFITAGKAGSLVSGLLDALAVAVSLGLQHGVPLKSYTEKMRGMRFEPDGASNLSKERAVLVVSIVDAIARWLDEKFHSAVEPPTSAKP